jgi:cholest-4-en-3-one 26-monooxygenase
MDVAAVPLHDPGVYERGVPHDVFDELRRASPVYWQPEQPPGLGYWALTRHQDVLAASRDPQTFSSYAGTPLLADFDDEVFEILAERVPGIQPAGPVRRLRSNFINSIKEMPVRLCA